MKSKNIALFMIFILIASLMGCATGNGTEVEKNTETSGDLSSDRTVDESGHGEKIKVITTLFPQYDFVRQIAGDKVEVSLLIPPGVEAHAYEPTPQDIVSIEKADVFIYTGEAMEPWAHKIIETVGEDKVFVIEAGEGLFDLGGLEHTHSDGEIENHDHDDDHGHEGDDHEEHEHDDHDAEEGHDDHDDHDAEEGHDDHDDHDAEEGHDDHDDHDHGGVDPHIWLDPIKAQEMVLHIKDGLIEIAPEHETEFRSNAEAYIKELDTLHHDFEDVFTKTESKTIMSGGHFAFGHFIDRYGLEYKSPYKGFAPDAEPTPKKIAELIEAVKASNVKAIYYEELVDPRVAKIVAEETDAEMLLLHAAHNLSKEELESGVTYIQIMRNNMENLKKGLDYREGE